MEKNLLGGKFYICSMKRTLAIVSCSLLLAAAACSPDHPSAAADGTQTDTTVTPGTPADTTVTPAPPEPDRDWSWTDGYPVGVTVEPFTEDLGEGDKCLGFVATIDFAENPNLRFICTRAQKKKGPSAFFADLSEDQGKAVIATNGGYFAGSTSVSLVAHAGNFVINAFRAFNWPNDENAQTTIYPVRSAIGRMPDGHFEIRWVYCTSVAFKTHTAFPSWLDNNEKTETFMSEPPTADYCEGTWSWEPEDAIGGGPRLVRDGVDVSTDAYWGECLDSGGTAAFSRVPRTAAGITADGRLVLIVCDGRGSGGSKGYTLTELAAKFISLGCTDAMNLDGGGSSCIVGSDGKILNNPSDGSERAVSSAVIISEIPHN